MKPLKWVIIVSVAMILIGGIGAILTFPKSIVERAKLLPFSEEKSIPAQGIDSIRIVSDEHKRAIGVHVKQIEGENIQIHVQGTIQASAAYETKVTTETSEISISPVFHDRQTSQTEFDKGFWDGFLSGEYGYGLVHIELGLPQKLYRSIQMELANAGVEMEDMSVQNTQLSIKNGEVHLVNTQGDIQADVMNGSFFIETEQLERNMNVQVENGDIEIRTNQEAKNVRAELSVTNGTGEWFGNEQNTFRYGQGQYQIQLRVQNGDILADMNVN